MFYLIVSKLPLIASLSDDSKLTKILVIGSICYIVLHAFLFSSIGENIEASKKFRSYLYYLWGLDIAITGIMVKFLGNGEVMDEDEDIEHDEQPKLLTNGDNNMEPNKMTRDEILKRLQEMRKNTQNSNDGTSNSPFIKKTKEQENNVVTSKQRLAEPETLQPSINESAGKNSVTKNEEKTNNDDEPVLYNNAVTSNQRFADSKEQEQKPIVKESVVDTEIPLYK